MATQMTKSQLLEKLSTITELSKRDVKHVMDTLTDVGHKELKKERDLSCAGLREVRRREETSHQGQERHQPVYGRRDDVQGKAGPQDRSGKAGQSCQGRRLKQRPPHGGLLFECLKFPQEESISNMQTMLWPSCL